MQPQEFNKMLEGYKWRTEERDALITYFAVPIINSQGGLKKPITIKDLLDPLKKQDTRKKQEDKEYLKQVFNL